MNNTFKRMFFHPGRCACLLQNGRRSRVSWSLTSETLASLAFPAAWEWNCENASEDKNWYMDRERMSSESMQIFRKSEWLKFSIAKVTLLYWGTDCSALYFPENEYAFHLSALILIPLWYWMFSSWMQLKFCFSKIRITVLYILNVLYIWM